MTFFSTSSIRIDSPAAYTGYPPSPAAGTAKDPETTTSGADAARGKPAGTEKINGQTDELALAELLEIDRLKQRDREVTAHEMAHIAAGGPYVRGGATFQYQYGPDGRRYAVGGEVSIDMSSISGDPETTAAKMRTVISAALAPASPSAQDRMVAAKASRIQMDMQMELIQLRMTTAKAEYRKTAGASSPPGFPPVQPKSATPGYGGDPLHLIG